MRMHVYTTCMKVWVHNTEHVKIRTLCDRGFSPSIKWILEIELISSGLVAHIFISLAILLVRV